MPEKYWKVAERKVGKILGGQRNTHDKGSNVPDVVHPWLAPEVKSRETIPNWLIEAIVQAETNATDGKLPVVCLMEKGGMHLAILRLETFAEYFVK
ncbi:hypothetical protein ACFLXA_02745 [Chloroflexota bacterium]